MITLVSGLPATGKSTLARRLGGPVLDFDDYVQDRFGETLEEATRLFHEHRAHEHGRWIARIRATPGAVVVDCLTTRAERMELVRALAPLPVRLVYLVAPLELLLERNAARPCPRPEGMLLHRFHTEELPTEQEGFVSIYLKKVGAEVEAFGDLETMRNVLDDQTLEADAVVSEEDWAANGSCARVEGSSIVLGKPADVLHQEHCGRIRYERDVRLRKCDKMNPMRWASMTEEQQRAWVTYRQALLDVPQQEGFPWNGDLDKAPWPTMPADK